MSSSSTSLLRFLKRKKKEKQKSPTRSSSNPLLFLEAGENRSLNMVAEYKLVFDSILLTLGLTYDTAVAPVRSSAAFSAACDGSLQLDADNLYTHFSMPYVVVKRLFPIAEELRRIMSALSQAQKLTNEQWTLFNHKVIQFMRCYASVAKFCPKFYLSALFEWLIAQCVELSALFQIVRDSGTEGRKYPQLARTCGWVQGNVAFLLCFIRGTHFQTLLISDYENGLNVLQNQSFGSEAEVTADAMCTVMEGLKTQVERLDEQVELYTKASASVPEVESNSLYCETDEMVWDTTWNTVNSLCTSVKRVPDLETVVAPLYRIFGNSNREMDLVHWAIDQDISEGIKDANLLFRQASTATRLLRVVFFSPEGTAYLKQIIYPSLKKLVKACQKMSLELDPFRVAFDLEPEQRDELIRQNAKTLLGIAGDIMTAASKSVDSVPIPIRKFLLYARNTFMGAQRASGAVDEGAATKLIVASLYFLRFLSPAIVTPQAYGLFDEAPVPEVQRSLVLLGKVLQNTACGVEFDGTKEEFMSCCNSFVQSNSGTMTKLFNALIDAQGIGTRELKSREKAAKTKKNASKIVAVQIVQEEFEQRVFHLRDCALIVNEFGLKQSFMNMFRAGGGSDRAVRTLRSLVKLDVKMHEQRASTRAEHIMARSLTNKSSMYHSVLLAVVADFAAYLPNDLVVFSDFENLDFGMSSINLEYSDTSASVGQLTHPLLLLDTITAHRPSRLAAVARMLRASCQEVWEAGIALRDLCVGPASAKSFYDIMDQESPVSIHDEELMMAHNNSMASDSFEESDSDTQSVAPSSATTATTTTAAKPTRSTGKKIGSKLVDTLRSRSGSLGGPGGPGSSSPQTPPQILLQNTGDGSQQKNSLAGLVSSTSQPNRPTHHQRGSSSFLLSPFSSPGTLRKRKAFKKRGQVSVGADPQSLWAPALVIPQVLGLLHFLTVLRHTLKHARLENRIVLETPDVDSVLTNCVFEYSKFAKQAGSQLLSIASVDPTNPEVGHLGLAIANAGVLLTRAALKLMNVDRQILRRTDTKRDKKPDNSFDSGDSSAVGSSVPAGVSSPATRPRSKSRSKNSAKSKKKVLQKSTKTGNFLAATDNPLASEYSPRLGRTTVEQFDDSESFEHL